VNATQIGIVAGLWRFPVKSFGGERARRLFVGPYGVQGDRCHAVVAPDGSVITVRRAGRMLAFRARFDDPEASRGITVATPDGRELAVDDPELAVAISAELGRDARLARSPVGVFDAAPLHIVTDASVRRMDEWVGDELDVCRFRANVVVELAEPEAFAEAGWVGRRIALGDGPMAEVVSPTERCAVTTLDPDTLHRDNRVLATLAGRLENLFGVYAHVVRPGWLHVGDPVVLMPARPAPAA